MTITIPHVWLYLTAFICFVLAALPTGWRLRCEWLAFAALTLTYLM